jgi:SAM-dependent methyltransferase
MPQIPAELADHPDRLRWNERYRAAGYVASFAPHPLAAQALSMPPPAGPVLDLASGPSGSALLAAAAGRRVTAVDASDVALGLLAQEARRRYLDGLITLMLADLGAWRPDSAGYSLVLCTGFWDRAVFAAAAGAVRAGGLIGWEALTEAARRDHPRLPQEWCVGPGEPAGLLPAGFEVISQDDVGPEPATRRRLLARATQSGPRR